jgi:hypothetical protein
MNPDFAEGKPEHPVRKQIVSKITVFHLVTKISLMVSLYLNKYISHKEFEQNSGS